MAAHIHPCASSWVYVGCRPVQVHGCAGGVYTLMMAPQEGARLAEGYGGSSLSALSLSS